MPPHVLKLPQFPTLAGTRLATCFAKWKLDVGTFLLATWTLVGWGAVRIRVWDRMIWLRTGADFLICVFMLIWTFATIGAGWVVVTAIHTSYRLADRRVVLVWLYSTGHSFCWPVFECAR